jgi:hypothetical protein
MGGGVMLFELLQAIHQQGHILVEKLLATVLRAKIWLSAHS